MFNRIPANLRSRPAKKFLRSTKAVPSGDLLAGPGGDKRLEARSQGIYIYIYIHMYMYISIYMGYRVMGLEELLFRFKTGTSYLIWFCGLNVFQVLAGLGLARGFRGSLS